MVAVSDLNDLNLQKKEGENNEEVSGLYLVLIVLMLRAGRKSRLSLMIHACPTMELMRVR